MDQHITTPITEEVTKKLHSGDYVYITGTIYVARDAAHKRMIEALDRGDQLPIDIKDATIYYMGPSPAREGRPIGSAGPTTATRMDKYAPTLLSVSVLHFKSFARLIIRNWLFCIFITIVHNHIIPTFKRIPGTFFPFPF